MKLAHIHARLQQLAPIPEPEWNRALKNVQEERVPRRGYFLKPGDDSSRMALCVEGLFQFSRVSPKGVESIKAFRSEGDVIAAYPEMLQRVPVRT